MEASLSKRIAEEDKTYIMDSAHVCWMYVRFSFYNKYLKKCEDQGACLSPLPFELFGLAGKEVLGYSIGSRKQFSEESI